MNLYQLQKAVNDAVNAASVGHVSALDIKVYRENRGHLFPVEGFLVEATDDDSLRVIIR